MQNVDFKIMGVNFRPATAKAIIDTLEIGDELDLSLVRDPENPYDANAIQVIENTSGEFIGFVEKEIAKILAPLFDAGATASGFEVVDHFEGKKRTPVIRFALDDSNVGGFDEVSSNDPESDGWSQR